MAASILQEFLDRGMLPIGEDDQKFEYLQQAAEGLAEVLRADAAKLIPYTAVALDPDIPLDEPVLSEAEAAIRVQWKSYRNKFPDTPRQLIRAVLLEAVTQTADGTDPAATAIVWLTGSSLFPWIPLGSEEEVLQDFLKPMGEAAEKWSVEEWANNRAWEQSLELPELDRQIEASNQYATTVDEAALAKHMMAAAGPTNAQNMPSGTDANPHWPNNSPQAWAAAFGPRAAKGIKETVDKANAGVIASVDASLKTIPGVMSEFAASMNSVLMEVLKHAYKREAFFERKSDLLWWKETLYSTTLKTSYRRLERATAAICTAYDLAEQVSGVSPQSIEFLLREVMWASFGPDAREAVTVAGFCHRLQEDERAVHLRETLGADPVTPGRGSLLSFVRGFLHGQVDLKEIKNRVGISEDTEMPYDEIAVWLFRDWQALHLVQGG